MQEMQRRMRQLKDNSSKDSSVNPLSVSNLAQHNINNGTNIDNDDESSSSVPSIDENESSSVAVDSSSSASLLMVNNVVKTKQGKQNETTN